MKKLITVIISTITLCTCVQAQSDQNTNPLNVARAFALKPPAYFICQLQGQGLDSNNWQQMWQNFVVRKSDFAITNLAVNGTAIPLLEPIFGLPLPDGGIIQNVWVNASAFTKTGEFAGDGYTQMNQLVKDSQIEVLLRPASVRQEIPVDLNKYEGGDIQVDIEDFIYGYSYGPGGDGKFYISTPPIGGKYHYILRSRNTGRIIGEGDIEPFKPVTTPNNGYFGIRYIGDVVGADFNNAAGEEWITVPNIQYNCSIPIEGGTNVIGKVIFTDVGPTGGLELIIGSDVDIYVQQASANEGDMPSLVLEDHSFNNGWYIEKRVNTVLKSGIGPVVITIIPKSNSTRGSTWFNMHRYYGLPSSVSSGGGGGGNGGTITEI